MNNNLKTFCPTFYRTYSKKNKNGSKENWNDVVKRCIDGIKFLGGVTETELSRMEDLMTAKICLPSGRWLWVSGGDWIKEPRNYSGAYNCSSTNVTDLKVFGDLAELCMCGCGIGANLEHKYIDNLPTVKNKIHVELIGNPGDVIKGRRVEDTTFDFIEHTYGLTDSVMPGGVIIVGDSRKGWVDAYQKLIDLAFDETIEGNEIKLFINVGNVRPKGELIKGFGGVANPSGIKKMFVKVCNHLNKAVGRQLTSVEVCLIINEAGLLIEEGGIRRSAGIIQFDKDDLLGRQAKQNLWVNIDGKWTIDPNRDALRMANHTFVYHQKPSLEECIESVRQQFISGEGAIQYAPEAIARANADILNTTEKKKKFIEFYETHQDDIQSIMVKLNSYANYQLSGDEIEYRVGINGLNPCITGDSLVFTDTGVFEVNELIGKQSMMAVNGEFFPTTEAGFFCTGKRDVYKLITVEGFQIKLTDNHKVLKLAKNTSSYTYTEWVEAGKLKPGDKIYVHDHYNYHEWEGKGTENEGIICGKEAANSDVVLNSSIEKTSYDFYIGFLHGIFKGNARITFNTNSSPLISLPHTNIEVLRTVQRMLVRIGIISRISMKETDDFNGFTHRKYYGLTLENSNIYRFLDAVSPMCFEEEDVESILYSPDYENLTKVENYTVTFAGLIHQGVETVYDCQVPDVNRFDANGLVVHNCGEIILQDNYCNLSEVHLNLIDPLDLYTQAIAFEGCALFATPLLKHKFPNPRYQKGRDYDPIVGVSISGVFDFFVKLFGTDYVLWLDNGRPEEWHGIASLPVEDIRQIDDICTFFEQMNPNIGNPLDEQFTHISFLQNMGEFYEGLEKWFYEFWKNIVKEKVAEYCEREGLKKPNRCTTIQPSGTKSLLTGGSPGIHFSWGKYWIRRIKFVKGDPVAEACAAAGYNIVPGQNDKDENGDLLNDPHSPLCTEWIVEIPCKAPWLDHVDEDRLSETELHWPALAHFKFYMNAQKHYVEHNGSVTINLSKHEIEPLATAIHSEIGKGYLSAALLPRSDAPFPRLPYERISKDEYLKLISKIKDVDFQELLGEKIAASQVEVDYTVYQSACSSGKCEL